MTVPPPYPRIPYLWRGDAGAGDQVVGEAAAEEWLREPVTVEEKLDGANVSLWLNGGRVSVASRGGPGAMDRASQLGRLRAWAAERNEQLRALLDGGWAMYGEWMWLRHGVAYDRLPDLLIVLDLWQAGHGFATVERRDMRSCEAGLTVPSRLLDGVLGTSDRLIGLLGQSAFSTELMEGAVLRKEDGRRAKVLRPDFRRRTDGEWSRRRIHNHVEVAAGRRPARTTQPS